MPKFVQLPFAPIHDEEARNYYDVNVNQIVLIQEAGVNCNIWFSFGGPWLCRKSAFEVMSLIDER